MPDRKSLARWLLTTVVARAPYRAVIWARSCQTVTSWTPWPAAVDASASRSASGAMFAASSSTMSSGGSSGRRVRATLS